MPRRVKAASTARFLLALLLPGASPCALSAQGSGRLGSEFQVNTYTTSYQYRPSVAMGFERGAPVDFYTRGEAERAIADAEAILEFCRHQMG